MGPKYRYYVYFSLGTKRHEVRDLDLNAVGEKGLQVILKSSKDGKLYLTEEEARKACLKLDREKGTWGISEGEGYIIRTNLAPLYDGFGYWTGYTKEPRFSKFPCAAKIYEDIKTAEKTIQKKQGQEFWDKACIIKVHFKEELNSISFSKDES